MNGESEAKQHGISWVKGDPDAIKRLVKTYRDASSYASGARDAVGKLSDQNANKGVAAEKMRKALKTLGSDLENITDRFALVANGLETYNQSLIEVQKRLSTLVDNVVKAKCRKGIEQRELGSAQHLLQNYKLNFDPENSVSVANKEYASNLVAKRNANLTQISTEINQYIKESRAVAAEMDQALQKLRSVIEDIGKTYGKDNAWEKFWSSPDGRKLLKVIETISKALDVILLVIGVVLFVVALVFPGFQPLALLLGVFLLTALKVGVDVFVASVKYSTGLITTKEFVIALALGAAEVILAAIPLVGRLGPGLARAASLGKGSKFYKRPIGWAARKFAGTKFGNRMIRVGSKRAVRFSKLNHLKDTKPISEFLEKHSKISRAVDWLGEGVKSTKKFIGTKPSDLFHAQNAKSFRRMQQLDAAFGAGKDWVKETIKDQVLKHTIDDEDLRKVASKGISVGTKFGSHVKGFNKTLANEFETDLSRSQVKSLENRGFTASENFTSPEKTIHGKTISQDSKLFDNPNKVYDYNDKVDREISQRYFVQDKNGKMLGFEVKVSDTIVDKPGGFLGNKDFRKGVTSQILSEELVKPAVKLSGDFLLPLVDDNHSPYSPFKMSDVIEDKVGHFGKIGKLGIKSVVLAPKAIQAYSDGVELWEKYGPKEK